MLIYYYFIDNESDKRNHAFPVESLSLILDNYFLVDSLILQ